MEVSEPMNDVGGIPSNKPFRLARLIWLIGAPTEKIRALVRHNKGM
jgi:hypothetical protein